MRIERLGVEFIHGDLRSASNVAGLPVCDWVIDAAANPSVLAGLSGSGSSRRLFEHNLTALGNVLEHIQVVNARYAYAFHPFEKALSERASDEATDPGNEYPHRASTGKR